MSGVTLGERVRRLRPGTRVLFMSGYSDEAIDAPPLPQADLITKPFRPGGLLRKVRELLDAPAPEVEESAPHQAAGRRRG
jgi:DNA-binding NtrC family response regulator